MMAYADSSLLLKLYLREPETPAALAAVRALAQPIAFTYLHRLEIGKPSAGTRPARKCGCLRR